ncbi:hypothetical protein SD71_13330 [Cohnella kolymensis]|uniref:Aminotransferase class V domain-containing protein n=1 Tax=Cohnella kolymensis TaxID=1590652 RepID=A0ABR5A376_9BACL|nr:aminotransferase class V-fold PLP-dependent enzyme [Cohnella kolymensis]KIL35490.1 hypothetical protein SD71_13330 [Cohnella kolymensis]
MKALLPKDQFIGLDRCTWLFSGAETPSHRGSLEAMTEYMHYRSLGPKGRERNAVIEAECKQNLAALMQGQAEDIALLSNSSEAISMIARAMDFKPGDNVIIHTLEFPSGVLPWLALQQQGVEIRVISHQNWQVEPADLLSRMDDRTRLVMTSHVSYLTGSRIDYKALYREIKKTDALLMLDVTQSLGVVPVEMYDADFVVCSSYKWLLSVHGVGILGINPRRTSSILPKYVGWRSVKETIGSKRFESFDFQDDARRFELGYPSYSTIYALNFSSALLLDIGIENIESHVLSLGSRLISDLRNLGFDVMTPEEPVRRAGNICVKWDAAEDVAQKLMDEQVYIMGSDGRIRASIHLFNDAGDVGRLIELLPACTGMRLREGGR